MRTLFVLLIFSGLLLFGCATPVDRKSQKGEWPESVDKQMEAITKGYRGLLE